MEITPQEFARLYTTGALLGKGGFGTVYAGYRNSDHTPVAIKMISKNRTQMVKIPRTKGGDDYIKMPMEVALMRKTSHIEGVIQLLDYFVLPDCYLLVMERMGTSATGCKDLFDFISDNGPLKEDLARTIFNQVVKTVSECHKSKVIHRDIKDENILIDSRTNKIKLIDFGSGAKLHDDIYTDFDGKYIISPCICISMEIYYQCVMAMQYSRKSGCEVTLVQKVSNFLHVILFYCYTLLACILRIIALIYEES